MNKYPIWKNVLLLVIFLFAVVYAVPNLYGEDKAVQFSSTIPGGALTTSDLSKIKSVLNSFHLVYDSAVLYNKNILVRFADTDDQLKAKGMLESKFSDKYLVALSLEAATPKWLMNIGANPMKLGLDLRGGVHLLLQVDVDSVVKNRLKSAVRNVALELRRKMVRYAGISSFGARGIKLKFRKSRVLRKAKDVLERRFPEYKWLKLKNVTGYQLLGRFKKSSIHKIRQYTIEQTMTTLRRRVNALGVSEAVVQQDGASRVSVDLPGIQDATQAKNILGKTATLEFHLVDTKNDAADAAAGLVPTDDELFNYMGHPVLLKSRIVLSGDSITRASISYDQSGRPSVNVKLGGGGESLFEHVTSENIGKPLSVVYVEIKSHKKMINGKLKITYKKEKRIINIATIQSTLGSNFQITGLSNPVEAKTLSLLLRAGALPAAVTVIEEQTVGPSMGKRNIHLGRLSIDVGMLLIVLFMAFYYSAFGLIADIGLFINLILLVAVLSLLGATLTFPGIAGIVLTVGMAVDYNVLIYERIREELRRGMAPQLAIHTGYERAFVTILDANLTTLIVALILFALGTGAVKGFAITLTIGLFTSIVSSVTYTRALVNWIYGGRRVKHLMIGIKPKHRD